MVTKVVSICLFGGPEEKDYGSENWFTQWLPTWLRAQFNVFPDFDLWLYHDSALYQSWYGPALAELERQGKIKLIYVKDNERRNTAMVWRHMAIFEPGVELAVLRDIDTIPTPRDRRAVQEFIDSDYIVHGINASPQHNQAMMHGMVAFKCKPFIEAMGLRDSWAHMFAGGPDAYDWSSGGAAQNWMGESVWPRIKDRALFHALGEINVSAEGVTLDHQAAETRHKITGDLPEGCLDGGDHLLRHLGAPTYDTEVAMDWYRAHGSIEIEDLMIDAEGHTGRVRQDRPRRRAILACDDNPNYAFTLPLTCLTWSVNTDLVPTVLLVGTPEAWHADPFKHWVAKHCLRAGADIYWLGDFDAKTSTVAQVSRLFAFEIFPDAEYLLTTDAELWILDGSYFKTSSEALDLYAPHAYDLEGKMRQPMPYLGGSAKTWAAFMGGGTLADALANVDHAREWFTDEDIVGQRMRVWEGPTRDCDRPGGFWRGGELHKGKWRGGDGGCVNHRVERAQNFDMADFDGAIDANMRRNGWEKESWAQYVPVMERALPEAWPDWRHLRDEYMAQFGG